MQRQGACLPCPVICIGNFTAGGSGKTPLALIVAKMLQAGGKTPFFLTRGYGGTQGTKPMRVNPALHSAAQTGDEPLLLAAQAPVIVGADRLAAAQMALAQGADVLVMDDGLQNPSLRKTLGICVVDGATGFGNGLCLPAGPLRAPVAAQWPFVGAVVVVGEGSVGDQVALAAKLRGKPVFRAQLRPNPAMAASLNGTRVVAFAGIGRPAKFFDTLARTGAILVETRSFADHHRFTPAQMHALQDQAQKLDAKLVTTAKDMVRIPQWPGQKQPQILSVELQLEEEAALDRLLAMSVASF